MKNLTDKGQTPEVAEPITDRPLVSFTKRQEWIRSAQAVFKDSLSRTLLTYKDAAPVIVPMYLSFIQENTIEGITTISGFKALSDKVHCEQTMRELMRLLQANFFTSWAEPGEAWNCLIESLASGLAVDPVNPDSFAGEIITSVPEEITERTMNTTELLALLQSNKWFVLAVMVFLWGGLD
jgi:hypothetical protein